MKPYFREAWNEPRRFCLWLVLLSLVGLGIAFILEQKSDFSPPRWLLIVGLLSLVGCVLGFVLGVLGFILSWIPAIYRLEVRLLRRRFFVVACLITFIALLNAEENWRGKRAWENFKHEWEAKAERFDLVSFIPPPVPDDQNFALTPLLKPLYDFTRGTNGLQWNDTNGVKHIEHVRADLGSENRKNRLTTGSLEKGSFTDFNEWKDFYLGNTNYPHPTISGTAAEDVLFALGKFNQEMKELSEAAITRPSSRFPIQYHHEPPSDILLPHLTHMKGLCFLFQLRAVARLEAGQTEDAFQDLKVGFRLSDSIRDEPLLIDHLVRLSMCSINLQTLREGLVRHAWSDAQLAELEKYLGSLDLLSELKQAMRGERAFNVAGIDFIRRQGILADQTTYLEEDGGAQQTDFGFGFMPSGWLYQNMLTIAQMHQQFTIAVADEKQHRVFPDVARANTETVEALFHKWSPHNIFARLMFPAFGKTGQKSGRFQTFVDAARIACALERYRLTDGSFPEKLDALVPQFMEKLPNDVIDGKPLRYRPDNGGGYILYSIGWNQTDDDGEIGFGKGKKPSVDPTKGDWVWVMSGDKVRRKTN